MGHGIGDTIGRTSVNARDRSGAEGTAAGRQLVMAIPLRMRRLAMRQVGLEG